MIRFESEKAFEDLFFQYLHDEKINPINGLIVNSCVRQPEFADYGRGDILAVDTVGDKKIIHLIELKITPLEFSHIAQICRYKDFIINSGLANHFPEMTATYSLINCHSKPSKDILYLAESAGIDLYFYNINFNGIDFDYYESYQYNEKKTAEAGLKLKSLLEVEIGKN